MGAIVGGHVRVFFALRLPLCLCPLLGMVASFGCFVGLLRPKNECSHRQRQYNSKEHANPSVPGDFPQFFLYNDIKGRFQNLVSHVFQVDLFHVRVGNFARLELGYHLSALHDSNVGADLTGTEEIVGGHEHRDAFISKRGDQL